MSKPQTLLLEKFPLDFQWPTQEPFLFCVHHLDLYPAGTSEWGPRAELLRGRNIGQDFQPKDGFRMYHGETVPGFPVHPHRGFETVTIVRRGIIDHADSLGAAGRYGGGDLQWMTAGSGVQHSEMFPLLDPKGPNTVELFQIWMNLPARNKMTAPDFKMIWNEQQPVLRLEDRGATVRLLCGSLPGMAAPPSPPSASWAADPANETLIALVELRDGGHFELPVASAGVRRSLYFYEGESLELSSGSGPNGSGERLSSRSGAFVDANQALRIAASGANAKVLVLQSRPIGEPIAQYGPFVMNTRAEIERAFSDFRATEFGGWPWPRPDMVHGGEPRRFAKYPDGRTEQPPENESH